jgi:hypothetical protein
MPPIQRPLPQRADFPAALSDVEGLIRRLLIFQTFKKGVADNNACNASRRPEISILHCIEMKPPFDTFVYTLNLDPLPVCGVN